MDPNVEHAVVVNAEQQYSVWRAHLNNPPGWTTVAKANSRAEALALVDELWRDVRPLSARRDR